MTDVRSRHNRQSATPATSQAAHAGHPAPTEAENEMSPEVEEQLNLARVSRSQAESARQRIANEILEATKEVCQKLVSDGEQTLAKARHLEAEAQQKHVEVESHLEAAQSAKSDAEAHAKKVKAEAEQQAQKKLDQAQTTRSEADAYREQLLVDVQQQVQAELSQAQAVRDEADSYRDKVMAEAEKQAQEVLHNARAAAEKECSEMKQRASVESQKMLSEAQLIKAAADEELEAQRIYVEASRLEAESREVLAQVRARMQIHDEAKPTALDGDTNPNSIMELSQDRQAVHSGVETTVSEMAPILETSTEAKPKKSTNGKKPNSNSKG